MRVFCLRRRVLPGDRLVLNAGGTTEYLTEPIRTVGTETVVLVDGTLVPFPPGKGCDVERE